MWHCALLVLVLTLNVETGICERVFFYFLFYCTVTAETVQSLRGSASVQTKPSHFSGLKSREENVTDRKLIARLPIW